MKAKNSRYLTAKKEKIEMKLRMNNQKMVKLRMKEREERDKETE